MKISVSKTILSLLAVSSSVLAQKQGIIKNPVPGQLIDPGSYFQFAYSGVADYGVSSYALTVWLLGGDVLAKPLSLEQIFTSGWYFGRYDYPNYPAIPYESHPAPPRFLMPDFSKNQGGWGSGKNANDAVFTLVVIEEWADGLGSLGHNFAVTGNTIIYNGTYKN